MLPAVSRVEAETKPHVAEVGPQAAGSKPQLVDAKPQPVEPKPQPVEAKPQALEAKLPAPPASEAAPTRVEPSVEPPARANNPHLAVANADDAGSGGWLWAAAAALAFLALLWSFLRWRRQRLAGNAWLDDSGTAPLPDTDEIAPASARPAAFDDGTPVVTSDQDLPTRLPESDVAELRRRYMEERFPELGTGMIDLERAPSVVKAARLLYEDGAAPRAIELLQFAVETHPAEVKHWLALFEIYRLERLGGGFAALAQRFREVHGGTQHWQKVRFFGREIDPENVLYREPLDAVQTIGPRESRRLAAAASFDPLSENWLDAPMDFENEVLANELRSALMQREDVKEEDLHPNPTSALRHVEMFTVA